MVPNPEVSSILQIIDRVLQAPQIISDPSLDHGYRSEAILAGFLAMIPPTCHVVRSGTLAQVPAQTLVVGDVVLIRMGDKTPADMVIIAATDLKVDNSSLTGESEPQERMPKMNGEKGSAVEAANIVFNSTMVVSGEGWGGEFQQMFSVMTIFQFITSCDSLCLAVVVRTGDSTFIGTILTEPGHA
jgi:P-type E1-E2 ATPase